MVARVGQPETSAIVTRTDGRLATLPPVTSHEPLLASFEGLNGRIGILGGTFDPVHNGHLELARRVMEFHRLDRIVFLPAHKNPLKANAPKADDEQRKEMLLLAVQETPGFFVSDVELKRQETSYTVDTLREIRGQVALTAQLFFIIGADCVTDLRNWKEHGELSNLANLVIVPRGEFSSAQLADPSLSLNPALRAHLEAFYVDMPVIDISATGVRSGKVDAVPLSVRSYIDQHGLYSNAS